MSKIGTHAIKALCMKDEKMIVKAILFDLDGTIFDITARDAFARFHALNELGYNVSLAEVKQHYRCGMGRMGLVKGLGIKLTGKEARKYIESTFTHFMEEEASSLTKIHRSAYGALSALSKKYKLVLVTSRNALSSTEGELERFDIRKFFSLVVTRDVAAKYHGHKELPLLPFLIQRKKLYECVIGLTKMGPKDMLCVGDSVGELQPARKLGIKTVGVLTGFSSQEELKNVAIYTINSLNKLSDILR